MPQAVRTPLTVYVVHHPDCEAARKLADSLFKWFRLIDSDSASPAAGVPVYFRSCLEGNSLAPEIPFGKSQLNVVLILVDHRIVGDVCWRSAVIELAQRDKPRNETRCRILPVALDPSFYRLGPLYEHFNPVRLIDLEDDQRESRLRRAATEATARWLRASDKERDSPPPLDVFLSHAKADGIAIAESIRDGVRRFGQMVPWFDANDLPHGASWEGPMTKAASDGTAALVAVVTDAYSSRPWCRREASFARTPRRNEAESRLRIWRVQPVVAVIAPGRRWSSGVSMLSGVPRVGWVEDDGLDNTERIVDRLVLEVLLGLVHRRVAIDLDSMSRQGDRVIHYLTWVPDPWSILAFAAEAGTTTLEMIDVLAYPGHGVSSAERRELARAATAISSTIELKTFEEIWA